MLNQYRMPMILKAVILFVLPALAVAQTESFDLVVYGGTAAGIISAVRAAREGLQVALLEPGTHVGGMATGGLSRTDFGKKEVIGGDALEFYWRVGRKHDIGRFAQDVAWFYEPRIGEQVFREMLNEAKVKLYMKTRLREKNASYKGYDIYESAPNSQGLLLLNALNILEGFDLKSMNHNSPRYVHVVTEALKLAFADRDHFISDPRFIIHIPVAGFLSKEYATERRKLIRMDRAIHGMAPPGDPDATRAILTDHTISYEDSQRPVSTATIGPVNHGETSSFSILCPAIRTTFSCLFRTTPT